MNIKRAVFYSCLQVGCFLYVKETLYLGKPEKEENKKAYDILICHKCEIEEKLGVALIWNRADDSKSSKISYQLDGISIENEADWFQMAKFHAEWSKKFCDVIVPYLR